MLRSRPLRYGAVLALILLASRGGDARVRAQYRPVVGEPGPTWELLEALAAEALSGRQAPFPQPVPQAMRSASSTASSSSPAWRSASTGESKIWTQICSRRSASG